MRWIKHCIILSCILFCSDRVTFAQDTSSYIQDKFKVYDIVSLDSFFLILAVKDDDVYRILSSKNNDGIICENEVLTGKYYALELKRIDMNDLGWLMKYKCECMDRGPFALGYYIDGISLILPMQPYTSIYLCLNINGLCPKN